VDFTRFNFSELKRLNPIIWNLKGKLNVSLGILNYKTILTFNKIFNLRRSIEKFIHNKCWPDGEPLFSSDRYYDYGDYATDHTNIFWFELNQNLLQCLDIKKFYAKIDSFLTKDSQVNLDKKILNTLALILHFHPDEEEKRGVIPYIKTLHTPYLINKIMLFLQERTAVEFPAEDHFAVRIGGSSLMNNFLHKDFCYYEKERLKIYTDCLFEIGKNVIEHIINILKEGASDIYECMLQISLIRCLRDLKASSAFKKIVENFTGFDDCTCYVFQNYMMY